MTAFVEDADSDDSEPPLDPADFTKEKQRARDRLRDLMADSTQAESPSKISRPRESETFNGEEDHIHGKDLPRLCLFYSFIVLTSLSTASVEPTSKRRKLTTNGLFAGNLSKDRLPRHSVYSLRQNPSEAQVPENSSGNSSGNEQDVATLQQVIRTERARRQKVEARLAHLLWERGAKAGRRKLNEKLSKPKCAAEVVLSKGKKYLLDSDDDFAAALRYMEGIISAKD